MTEYEGVTDMSGFSLGADEVILYEGSVKCTGIKGDAILTLTSERMIFEKEKGLFKKDKELVDIIFLDNIKIYNDVVQVAKKGSDITIQTVEKNVTISFSGMLEATKFAGKLVDTVTGTSLAKRGSNKVKNMFNIVDDTLGLDTRETLKGVLENGVAGSLLKGIKKK